MSREEKTHTSENELSKCKLRRNNRSVLCTDAFSTDIYEPMRMEDNENYMYFAPEIDSS